MNGKEFKEEITKIGDRNDEQTFFAIPKKDEDKLINFMADNDIYFQHYQDYGLLFADKEGTNILINRIETGSYNIPDDKEFKISPVTFVNKVTSSVYDKVICEDELSDAIYSEVESTFNKLMNDELNTPEMDVSLKIN